MIAQVVEYRTICIVRHHLDLQLTPSMPETCSCQRLLADERPTHILHCRSTSGCTTKRHTMIAQVVEQLCLRVGCSVERERVVLALVDETRVLKDIRGDDMTEESKIDLVVSPSTTFFVDISVHPAAEMHLKRDSSDSGKAIAERERQKRLAYGRVAKQQDAQLVPFVVDAYGRIGNSAQRFLRELAEFGAGRDACDSTSDFLDVAYSLVSVAIQRGNVRAVQRALTCVRQANARRLAEPDEPAMGDRNVNANRYSDRRSNFVPGRSRSTGAYGRNLTRRPTSVRKPPWLMLSAEQLMERR